MLMNKKSISLVMSTGILLAGFQAHALAADTAEDWKLCSGAEYSAHPVKGVPTLFAKGEVPTSGWKEKLQIGPEMIEPPLYRLLCLKPTGIVNQVVTPYTVSLPLPKSTKPGSLISVTDAAGKHNVEYKADDK